MTTTITVLNEGPKPVKIEVQERDGGGRFAESAEFRVEPGEFKRLSVHDHKSIQVIELDGEVTGGAA